MQERLAAGIGLWGTVGWTYDGAGNRLTAGTSTTAYPYSYVEGTNKIQKISAGGNSQTFSYDLNGNMITENKRVFAYNENQRLVSVKDSRTLKGQYVYNGNGQRVKKVANGVTMVFHYNLAGQVIAESAAAGFVAAEYVYLNENPLAKIEGNKIYYYHNDHLATPQKMTDGTGAVVWSADYKPFGETTITVSTITNNLRFPGQYYDAETGLNYNYFRDYNPVIGRYIEADPIGVKGGKNHLFIYVENNPVNRKDPPGLASLVTDMQAGTTTFDPRPEDPNGQPYTITTSNNVARNSLPGAQDSFATPDVTPLNDINRPAYGPGGAYIDTGDPRGRDVHGGGTGLPDPYAPRQGWMPTRGCTRGQNEDVQELNRRITDFRQRHPGVQIPYTRR